jgi:hypothetical protein
VLQQTPALWPFVQELITFAHVTSRARENKVRGVIGAAACPGNDMVDLIGILALLKRQTAIIATSPLRCIHTFDIGNGVLTRSATPPYFAIARVHTRLRFALLSLTIAALILTKLFGIGNAAQALLLTTALSLFLITSSLSFRSRFVACISKDTAARIAIAIQKVFPFSSVICKKFMGRGQEVLTSCAAPLPIWKGYCCSTGGLTALLTGVSQPVVHLLARGKKLLSSGEPLLAFFTAFLYTVTHGKNSPSYRHASGYSTTAGASSCPHYSINQHVKQVHATLYK